MVKEPHMLLYCHFGYQIRMHLIVLGLKDLFSEKLGLIALQIKYELIMMGVSSRVISYLLSGIYSEV